MQRDSTRPSLTFRLPTVSLDGRWTARSENAMKTAMQRSRRSSRFMHQTAELSVVSSKVGSVSRSSSASCSLEPRLMKRKLWLGPERLFGRSSSYPRMLASAWLSCEIISWSTSTMVCCLSHCASYGQTGLIIGVDDDFAALRVLARTTSSLDVLVTVGDQPETHSQVPLSSVHEPHAMVRSTSLACTVG